MLLHTTGVCPSTAEDDFTLNVPQLSHLVAYGHVGGHWLLASMSVVFLQTFLYVFGARVFAFLLGLCLE